MPALVVMGKSKLCFVFFFFSPKQCFELCELKTPKKAESSHVAL